jgi:hypothetical protein
MGPGAYQAIDWSLRLERISYLAGVLLLGLFVYFIASHRSGLAGVTIGVFFAGPVPGRVVAVALMSRGVRLIRERYHLERRSTRNLTRRVLGDPSRFDAWLTEVAGGGSPV